MNALFILSGMAALLTGLLSFTRGYRLARLLRAVEPCTLCETGDLPPVSVLAPCRGVDNHFESYAGALLSQDYPRYEVAFLVESTTDPAWNVLSRIVADMPESRASLIVTGPAEGCSQKIHNLLIGLDHVDPRTTILVFVDSDVQVHRTWLKELVAPLREPAIGATSGFRWYVPLAGSLSSSLRSAWNAATLSLMVHPRYGFAWGGSTAIRRELYERLKIRQAWSQGLSDDWLLTRAVLEAGLTIRFTPACLVPTREPCTWRQLVEWSTRQVTITRVYAPQTWRVALFLLGVYLALGLLGLIALVTDQWMVAGLLLSHWVLSGISSGMVCSAALHRLAVHGYTIVQRVWPQALWVPGVIALSLLNLSLSLVTRTITWRGISYTMLSAQNVVVHREAQMPAPSLVADHRRERGDEREAD